MIGLQPRGPPPRSAKRASRSATRSRAYPYLQAGPTDRTAEADLAPARTAPDLHVPARPSRVTTARTCTAPPPHQAITTGPIATATRRTPPPYDKRGSTSTSCARRRRRPGEVVAFACASKAKRASRPPGNRECFAIWGGLLPSNRHA